jgi:TRAP-type C4-dicarboxylate transport system permease large subunit
LGKISTVRAMKALFPFYVISLGVVIIAAAFPELMLSVPKYLMPQFMQ